MRVITIYDKGLVEVLSALPTVVDQNMAEKAAATPIRHQAEGQTIRDKAVGFLLQSSSTPLCSLYWLKPTWLAGEPDTTTR